MRIRVTSKASSRGVLSIQRWPLQLIAVVISGRQFFILWLESFPHLPDVDYGQSFGIIFRDFLDSVFSFDAKVFRTMSQGQIVSSSLVVLFSSSNRGLSLGDVVASLASTIAFPASRPATLDRRDPQPLVNSVLAFAATPILQRTLDQDRIKVRCVANQLSCRHYRGNTANRISSASHHGVGLISDLTPRRISSQR
jgi:hypothetical protein